MSMRGAPPPRQSSRGPPPPAPSRGGPPPASSRGPPPPASSRGAPPPAPSRGGGGGFAASPGAPSRTPAPSGGGDGNHPEITISGCRNPTVSKLISGSYRVHGSNHNKPVYKKTDASGGDVGVLIYFWDDRDGPNFGGWWVGPKVGGDQVWSHNDDKASPGPPVRGWKVPWDGQMDPSLQMLPRGGSGGGGGGGGSRARGGYDDQEERRGRERDDRDKQRADEQKRRQEEDRRRQDEQRKRQDEERRRQEEDKRRQEAAIEQKRRQEEAEKRRQEEERRRQEREAEKRRQEALIEQKRKEEGAKRNVQKVVQRLRGATPETFAEVRSELERVQGQEKGRMGDGEGRVLQEAQQAVKDAEERVDRIVKEREEAEKKRQEDERKRKVEEARVESVTKFADDKVVELEGKAKELGTKIQENLDDEKARAPDEFLDILKTSEKEVEAGKELVEDCLEIVKAQKDLLGTSDMAQRKLRDDFQGFTRRSNVLRADFAKLVGDIKKSTERLNTKMGAEKEEAKERAEFDKYAKDGHIKAEEVKSFAKDKYEVEHLGEHVDNIMKSLAIEDSGVPYEKFHLLRRKVGVFRCEKWAREKAARISEQKANLETLLTKAKEGEKEAQAAAEKAEAWGQQLSGKKVLELASEDIEAKCHSAYQDCAAAQTTLKALVESLDAAEQAKQETAEAKKYQADQVSDIRVNERRFQKTLDRVEGLAKAARETAKGKVFSEMEALKTRFITAVRANMTSEGKTGYEIFKQAGGDESLSCDKFTAFVKTLKELEDTADAKAEKLFKHLIFDSESLTRQRFSDIIRLFYKSVKATVLQEDLEIKAKTVRRLELEEYLEAIEGPKKAESCDVLRVKCRAVQDDVEGWATVAGNQGSTFLEVACKLFAVASATSMRAGAGQSLDDLKAVKDLEKDEVLEVIEYGKKDADHGRVLKAKSKSDGKEGWVTMSDLQERNEP